MAGITTAYLVAAKMRFIVIMVVPECWGVAEGGHTETVDALEVDLPTIWAKVEELSRVKR